MTGHSCVVLHYSTALLYQVIFIRDKWCLTRTYILLKKILYFALELTGNLGQCSIYFTETLWSCLIFGWFIEQYKRKRYACLLLLTTSGLAHSIPRGTDKQIVDIFLLCYYRYALFKVCLLIKWLIFKSFKCCFYPVGLLLISNFFMEKFWKKFGQKQHDLTVKLVYS